MAEERSRIDELEPQPQQISLNNDFLQALLGGTVEGEGGDRIRVARVQPDGTIRSWELQVGQDADGNERIIRIDEDRRPENILIVTDGDGNKIPIAGTEEGVLRVDISGSVKREEINLLKLVLNELRLHRMYWMETTENQFNLADLAELEVKET